ncbi:unnamed protein product, partial [Didymodactylos carnosus]
SSLLYQLQSQLKIPVQIDHKYYLSLAFMNARKQLKLDNNITIDLILKLLKQEIEIDKNQLSLSELSGIISSVWSCGFLKNFF